MSQLPVISKKDLKAFFLMPFYQVLKDEVELQKNLLSNTEKIYQSYYEKIKRVDSKNELSKYINESNWLKQTLYEILENEFPERKELSPEEIFESFFSKGGQFLSQFPESISAQQVAERFEFQQSDEFTIKISKAFKIAAFRVSKLPQKVANLFRKEKITLKRWRHKIPIRSMLYHFFIHEFFLKNLDHFRELQQLKCDALNLKWAIDKDLNIEVSELLEKEGVCAQDLLDHVESISKKNRIAELKNEFDRKLSYWLEEEEKSIDDFFNRFTNSTLLVDTIELSAQTFSTVKLEYGAKSCQTEFKRIFNGWRNTLFAQIDDFQVDIELYQIKYYSLLQFNLLQNSCSARIDKTIQNHIQLINHEFESLKKKVEGLRDKKLLIPQLTEERMRIKEKLQKVIIPNAIEALYDQNLPYLIERLEVKITEQINTMKAERIIYAKDKYDAPINKSDLSHFNPQELIKIDLLNPFSTEVKKLKSEVIQQIESVKEHLNDLISIADYNLNAATNSAEEKSEDNDVVAITIEGLERTAAKSKGIEGELALIQQLINERLKTAIDTLNKGCIKLTNNENVTAIRIKLAKAKAVKHTKDYGQQLVKLANRSLPVAIRFSRQKLTLLKFYFDLISKKLGLTESNKELTAKLSDFLSQTEESIERLPYVYRRLYQIKAVEEEVFFEGRTHELSLLKKAYKNWISGNYSATTIIGEKGSGTSSLINFFKKEIGEFEISRYKAIVNKSTEEELLEFFRKLLGHKKAKTIEELVEFLNSGNKRVIIIEDAQHFYLKKIDGFNALNLLFELISKTDDHVFWVLEFTSYAWEYLKKTISIQRYFKFIVELEKLTEQQIVAVIMKRHRVSGYNLRFENNKPTKQEIRKMRGMTVEEKQAFLQKSFFAELNQFAQTNISLALLYWLRSTSKLENNTIFMSKIENSRFDFLKTLQQESIFTLHTLLLHDSLSTIEHAAVFHQSERQSRMVLMVLEDQGVLNIKEGRFVINRILYRQVVNVLRNKNIIH